LRIHQCTVSVDAQAYPPYGSSILLRRTLQGRVSKRHPPLRELLKCLVLLDDHRCCIVNRQLAIINTHRQSSPQLFISSAASSITTTYRELTFRCLAQPLAITFRNHILNKLCCNISVGVCSNTEVANVCISCTCIITRA